MKQIILITSTLFLFNACSQIDGANPSQNEALNSVAGKTQKVKSGYMQNTLDSWLKNEWSPTVSGKEAPTGQTVVKIISNEDGSAKLVEVESGVVLKEMTKEQVKKQKEVQAKYKEEDRAFTLQEYVDKMSVYNSTHASDEKNSHVKKINAMPAIGTTSR